jgi:hypothetical protein
LFSRLIEVVTAMVNVLMVDVFALFKGRIFVKDSAHLILDFGSCHLQKSAEDYLLRVESLLQAFVL